MTDTKAIRERAERLIAQKWVMQFTHVPESIGDRIQEITVVGDDTPKLVGRDLLAALDREKVLAEEVAERDVALTLAYAAANTWMDLTHKAEAQLATLQTLAEKAVTSVRDLINDSGGVYGLHQNGDVAPWPELEKGGRFEGWLADFNALESTFPASAPKGEEQ